MSDTFPASDQAFIRHGHVTLSGNDVIAIAEALKRMRQQNLHQHPKHRAHYATLLSVLLFIVEARNRKGGSSRPAVQPSGANAASTKPASQTLSVAAQKLATDRRTVHRISRALLVREREGIALAMRQQQQGQPSQRRVPSASAFVFRRQVTQLCLQIKAFQYVSERKRLSTQLESGLKSFYSQSNLREWQQYASKRLPDPAATLAEVLATRPPATTPPPLQALQASRDAVIEAFLVKHWEGLDKTMSLYGASVPKSRAPPAGVNQREYLQDVYADTLQQLSNEMLPLDLRMESARLCLAGLQKKIRHEVLACMPVEKLRKRKYRSVTELGRLARARERDRKRHATAKLREERRSKKAFLTAVNSKQREFYQMHREHKRLLKRVSGEIKKLFLDREREQNLTEKTMAKERLKALKAKDQKGYIKLLKKAKNTRLLEFLRETEKYMKAMGDSIIKEQEREGVIAPVPEIEPVDEDDEEDDDDGGIGTSNLNFINEQKRYYAIANRVKEEVTKQPSAIVAGKLRKYQMAGLQWLVSLYNNRLNGILADEMGLGKTIQSISLIAWLMEEKKVFGPFLFIVPMSCLRNNWEFEFDKWLPSVRKVVYDGNKHNRQRIREQELKSGQYNVLLTTFEFAMRDKKYLKKIQWEYIIIDEAHRLKNPKCKLAQDLTQYSHSSRRVALTGTPLQNELPELWSLLNFLHPSIFNSAESFEKWFSRPFEGSVASAESTQMTEEEKLLVIDRLHSIVRPFMLRREKSEVETELLDKIERVLYCKMSPLQAELYKAIMLGRVSLQNRMMQLRKACNHPLLFHPYIRKVPGSQQYLCDDSLIRMCGKFILLDNILTKLKATGHRVLIFSQMVKTMDILADFFDFRGYKYLRLDGATGAMDRQQGLLDFNDADSEYFVFMLSTRAGGLGLNLQSADTVILFDSDWNPQNDKQAQARAHRIGQKKQVIVLRLITQYTVEEKVLSTALSKMDQERMVIQAGMFNKSYEADQSRKMVETVLREGGKANSHEMVDAEAVSRAIARDEAELEQFLQMDDEGTWYGSPMSSTEVPRWMAEFVRQGNKSRDDSCSGLTLEEIASTDLWQHEVPAESEEAKVNTVLAPRSARKTVSYAPESDRAFNKRINGDGSEESSSSDSDSEAATEFKVPAPRKRSPEDLPGQPGSAKRHHSLSDMDVSASRIRSQTAAHPKSPMTLASGNSLKITFRRKRSTPSPAPSPSP